MVLSPYSCSTPGPSRIVSFDGLYPVFGVLSQLVDFLWIPSKALFVGFWKTCNRPIHPSITIDSSSSSRGYGYNSLCRSLLVRIPRYSGCFVVSA